MSDSPESAALKHIGTDFLITDLDTAMVFLDVAETTQIPEVAERNRGNARRAYDIVADLLSRVKIDEAERETINTKLAALRKRLEGAGQQFCPEL
jgi:hypothetical protein